MDAMKRANFASKQLPAGPAPLASFEDLPSDELESPEDNFSEDSPSKNKQQTMKQISHSSNSAIPINTPDTITESSQSTPRVESDFDSQFTLTPSDSSRTPLTTEFHTGSFSSLSKEDTISVKQKKGSVVSLGNYIANDESYGPPKSSWTSVFLSQNDMDNPDQVPQDVSRKVTRKKSKSDLSKKDQTNMKSKDKGKFLSMFKGKKNGKSIDYVVSSESITLEEKGHAFDDAEINELDLISDSKENKLPKQIELHAIQIQNDLDKSSNIQNKSSKVAGNNKQNDLRNTLNISEKECNILPKKETGSTKAMNEKSATTKIEEEIESSESEIGFEAKARALAEKSNEIEAETLLPQDSTDVDDDSLIELCPVVFKVPNPIPIMSKQQRQDVMTIPIERPRSTTPINAAPLEAFIRSASPSFDPKVEKIKLSLPGEQFLGRLKSPKRNSSKSWADFCVEVLHSPRMQKRDDFPEQMEDVFYPPNAEEITTPCWDKFEVSESQWVTFEPNCRKDNLPDLFQNFTIPESRSSHNEDSVIAEQSVDQFSKCSCECHFNGCNNIYIYSNETGKAFHSKSVSATFDSFSDKCQCQCHKEYFHLSSPTNSVEEELKFVAKNDDAGLSVLDETVTDAKL